MFPIQQQIAAATRAQFEAQLGLCRELSETVIESIEKLAQLNLAAARASMEESSANARQLLQAQDAQQAMSLVRGQTAPAIGHAIAYGNHLINIATNAQADITRAAEMQIAESGRRALELVEEAAKNAPPGTESVIDLLRNAIGSASTGYEQFNRTSRRAVQALELNMNAAVNQIVKPGPATLPAGGA